MKVREAVQIAISYAKDIFEAEGMSNLGLEEVTFNAADGEWIVTVGFSRPWDYPKNNVMAAVANITLQPQRSYKVMRVRDIDGEVLDVKNKS